MDPQDRSAPLATTLEVPPLPEGWQVLRYAVLAGGRLGIVGAQVDPWQDWRQDDRERSLVSPDGRWLVADAGARLWTFDGSTLADGPSFPLISPFPLVDQFPDGRWLVADGRALDSPNGRLLTRWGDEVRRIRLGDGIELLKIDARGRIWVGWFDEGVYGNDDWRMDGHEWPPSSYGVAAFDEEGALVAHAEGPPDRTYIADCYALNVIDETAWACTYTDFPILACRPGEGSRWWPTGLSGTRALAVSGQYVVAAGGYAEEGDRVVLLRLVGDRAETLAEWRLPVNVGFPGAVDLIDARESELHVVLEGHWHRWTVDDFVRGAAQG